MRITDQRKQEIVRAFQVSFKRDNSEEINSIALKELKDTDEMIGNRDLNEGYRIALRNRISELEQNATITEQRSHESKIRAWNLITGIIIGLVIAGLAKWLFG